MFFLSCVARNAHCSTTFLLLLSYPIFVPLCNGYVNWIFPGPENSGLTFNYIDTVYFTWTSNITDPWMNLWCAPNQTSPTSNTYVYHSEVPPNGINPQSFPYSEYNQQGKCHMQVEDFAGDDRGDTPEFDITSRDGISPQTWGAYVLGQSSRVSNSTTVISLPSTSPSPPSLSTSSSTSPTGATSSSSPSAKQTSTSSPIAANTRAPTPVTSPSSSSKALSASAKAGVSIGSIGCALVFTIMLMLCRNARSR